MTTGEPGSPVLEVTHTSAVRRFLVLACLLLFPVLAISSCGKKETTPAGGTTAEAATPGAAPTVAEAVAPGATIRQTAESNRPPFAGLKSPRGLAMDDKGRLFVVDMRNDAIRIFDGSGGSLGGWGGRGTGHYGMKDPHAVSIHGQDVYVADTFGAGVELFTIGGDWKATADAGLYAPSGVAAASDGKVWIADTGNNRLIVCDRDLSNPRPIGKRGDGPEEFVAPYGIAVGPSGRIYVADLGNHRIQVLDAAGNFKAHWTFNGFPADTESWMDVDRDDSLFVSDSVAGTVVHLDHSGRELRRWSADDAGVKFSRPTGIALDRKARILYVVNSDIDSVTTLKLTGK